LGAQFTQRLEQFGKTATPATRIAWIIPGIGDCGGMAVQSEPMNHDGITCLPAKEGRSILGKPDFKCNPIPRQLPTFKLSKPQRRSPSRPQP
ncbi:MAG TPA: hypothetical protein VGH29_09105, partial [Candidatus Binataceae bacterium]